MRLLQSDATYLIVTDDGELENYGVNAVCTHLGCVVPWNSVSRQHHPRSVSLPSDVCPCNFATFTPVTPGHPALRSSCKVFKYNY